MEEEIFKKISYYMCTLIFMISFIAIYKGNEEPVFLIPTCAWIFW